MSFPEAGMLICFGVSWPLSILKTLRTRQVSGKSPLFLAVVAAGYICGILHKLIFSFDLVLILYCFNFTLVLLDLLLYFRFKPRTSAAIPNVANY